MKPDATHPSILEVEGREVGLLIPLRNGVQFFAADTRAFPCDRWTFASHSEARRVIIARCSPTPRPAAKG